MRVQNLIIIGLLLALSLGGRSAAQPVATTDAVLARQSGAVGPAREEQAGDLASSPTAPGSEAPRQRCQPGRCLPEADESASAQLSTSATFSMPAAFRAVISSPTVDASSATSLLLSTRLEP